MYFRPRLPRRLKTGMKSRLFQAALANDVLYVPGELCKNACRSLQAEHLRPALAIVEAKVLPRPT